MPTQNHQETDQQSSREQANKNPYQHPSNSDQAVEPSGPKGDNPSTAGPGPTKIQSNTPENRLGHINPSAPEDSNTTPGSAGKK